MTLQPSSKTSKTSIYLTKPIQTEVIVTTKKVKSIILKYKDGSFHVSKPPYVSQQQVVTWLESLSKSQFENLQKTKKGKQGQDYIYLFGHHYALKIYDFNMPKAILKENELCVYHKNYLETYLKQLLLEYLEKRILELSLVDFKVKVQIQKMTSKYGCCFYTQQKMKFALSLVHEPTWVIDSILIHELAHFYYPNHQKEFYAFVHQYDPNYDKSMAYLKKGGAGDDPIS